MLIILRGTFFYLYENNNIYGMAEPPPFLENSIKIIIFFFETFPYMLAGWEAIWYLGHQLYLSDQA